MKNHISHKPHWILVDNGAVLSEFGEKITLNQKPHVTRSIC